MYTCGEVATIEMEEPSRSRQQNDRVSLDADSDNGRPRTGGNIFEFDDDHVLELHLPLPETPLFVNLVVEWEQLPGVSELIRGRRSETHIAVFFEVINVPSDTLRDLVDQLTFRHRTRVSFVVPGGELFMYLSAMR